MRKTKTIDQLRAGSPGKFVFSFAVAGPTGPVNRYQGILPVKDIEEMAAFERRLRMLLLSVGGTLHERKPPKGFVNIRKRLSSVEEGE